MRKLSVHFYRRDDVLQIGKELLGKILVTKLSGSFCSGRIVELEVYSGVTDRASHAFGGRRTRRNQVMYTAGGVAYVYLCYGMHHLFNVVTSKKEVPHAILIRALEPLQGTGTMLRRRGKTKPDNSLTRGPGNLSKAMGIYTGHSGTLLTGDTIYIADDGYSYGENEIAFSPRIGVDYAGEDALLPYRLYIKQNPFVSGGRKNG